MVTLRRQLVDEKDESQLKADLYIVSLLDFQCGLIPLTKKRHLELISGFTRTHCLADSQPIATNLILRFSLFSRKIEFNPFVQEQRRWCYHCFASNQDDESKRFLKCTRCGVARYCNRDCQRGNWKFHKQSCRKMTEGMKSTIDALTADECVSELRRLHGSGGFDVNTAFYLKRIEHLIQHRLLDNEHDIGYALHCKIIRRVPLIPYFRSFFACPGIPEFMLNTPCITRSRFECVLI